MAKSRTPSASVRVTTKMTAAIFFTPGPKRRCSSSYRGEQIAAEVGGDEEHADEDAADDVAERELQERHVAGKCLGRDADEAEGARLRRHDREADRPPWDGTVVQEVVAGGFLEPREPRAEGSDCEEVAGDDRVVEPGQGHDRRPMLPGAGCASRRFCESRTADNSHVVGLRLSRVDEAVV